MPPDEVYSYDNIRDILEDNVIAMAAYRAYRILDYNNGFLDEKNEIPFITKPYFPILLLGYLLFARVRYLFNSALQSDSPRLTGHVLVVNSTATYRFKPFVHVGNHIPERVTFLCTKTPYQKMQSEYADEDWNIVSHRQLHGLIPLWSTLYAFVVAWRLNRRIIDRLGGVDEYYYRSVGYNLALTELIKSNSFREAAVDIKSIHTQSPSPYILQNGDEDNLYHYQHGRNITMVKRAAVADIHLTYFSWGPGWDPKHYCSVEVIEKIDFVPVGNPLYDELIDRRSERDTSPQFDVLIYGESQTLPNWEPETYEMLLETTIEFCEQNDLDLAIKLHPVQEDGTYYEQRGWDQYIIESDVIEAVLNSRITVMDCSSGFLESVIMGSPAVLTQFVREARAKELMQNIPGVYTPADFSDLEPTLNDALSRELISVEELNDSGVFRLGGTAERIASYVTDR